MGKSREKQKLIIFQNNPKQPNSKTTDRILNQYSPSGDANTMIHTKSTKN